MRVRALVVALLSFGAVRSIQVFILLALATQSPVARAAPWLAAQDAAGHIGEVATVCGTVASANFANRSKGQPTYLNLDRPYPNQVFTILIWGSDRPKFGTPETTLMGKRVCAAGAIKEYRGKPEIVATDPRQLTMQ
jgi:DNA/RNA endonuclease YhcR with UshA esterase domain